MERRAFSHDGLTFSYLDAGGAGAPLIALHATWMEAGTFAELADALRPSWRVLALDQRGHGHSDHSDDFTWDALIGDLAAFIEQLALTDPVPLLGNSLGGGVAYRYAARHPERVKAMIIEETGVVMDPDFTFMKDWAGTFPSREALLERIGPRLAWSVEPSIRKAGDLWTLAFSAEQLADAVAGLRGDFWADWKATRCPALVIRGSDSRVVGGGLLQQMAEERPNTILKTFHAGHVVHHDLPDEFASAVATFLEVEVIMPESRPPLPPFTRETAIQKIRSAEDAWNLRDPERVALAYTEDSVWRNRAEFVIGRAEIVAFLKRKWSRELDYRLIKELWAFEGNRIAVRYAYESHDDSGNWYRSYGNENWEFAENGLMRRRFSSINDLPIRESERKFHWPLGPRPADHPGLSDLGL